MIRNLFGTAAVAMLVVTSAKAQADWWNPVVTQTAPSWVITHNPHINHTHVHQHSHQVHASAMNPTRQMVAPGSMRYVDRQVWMGGVLYRQHGWTWRNAITGQPHSQLTTTRISGHSTANGFHTHSDSITSHRSRR